MAQPTNDHDEAAAPPGLADALPAMAWCADAAGAITWSNARWRAWRAEPGGPWTAACDPSTSGEALAAWAAAFARGEAWEGAVRMRGRDGSARWFATRVEPSRDAGAAVVRWVGTHVDVDAERRSSEAAAAVENARLLADARRAEDLARVEARRLRLALDAGRMGAWEWEPASGRVRWSPQVEAMYGVAPGGFGGTLAEYVARLHPDDRAAVRANVDRAVATGSELHHEHRVVWPDGTVRWIEGRGAPVFGRDGALEGLLGVCTDVTARKDAELRLREREASLRFLSEASAALAGSLDDAAMLATVARLAVPTLADCAVVDLAGADGALRRAAVAHVDPALEAVAWELGRRFPATVAEHSVIGRALRTAEPAWVDDVTPALLDALPLDPEQRALLKRVGLRSFVSVPLTTRARVAGVFTLATSAGERRFDGADVALATEVARRIGLALENAQLYREARDANRLKDEFLATMSHELRTPMTAILGWTAMLPSRLDDPAALRRGLEVIERNARAQARLIDDVLDVSRIVAGKLRLEATPVPFGAMVGAALDAIRPRAQAKGVALSVDLGADLGVVHGDADRLQQVVWNLCQNAVKFTPRGGSVAVRARRDGASVTLVVADTGQGIAAGFVPHVFERFRQADSTSTRAHGGLGLGLAITRHLVELHGGTVSAESAGEGLGATFTVTLPLDAGGAAPARAGERPEAPVRPGALAGLRVLVCDDEDDAREMVAEALRGGGATVTTAASAAEAFARIGEAPPDVLVSDIGMPGEDGYALLRRLRALPAGRGGAAPALALTAYAQADDARRAAEAGFQRHVAKPVEPERLIAAVAELGGRAAGG